MATMSPLIPQGATPGLMTPPAAPAGFSNGSAGFPTTTELPPPSSFFPAPSTPGAGDSFALGTGSAATGFSNPQAGGLPSGLGDMGTIGNPGSMPGAPQSPAADPLSGYLSQPPAGAADAANEQAALEAMLAQLGGMAQAGAAPAPAAGVPQPIFSGGYNPPGGRLNLLA